MGGHESDTKILPQQLKADIFLLQPSTVLWNLFKNRGETVFQQLP